MGIILGLIAIFVCIGLFFRLSNLSKLAFTGYFGFFIYEFINRDFGDVFFLYKLLMGGVVLFVFLVSISLAETKEGKKEVALFFLKYGGLYVIMIAVIKLVLFATAGFDTGSLEGIDVIVTLLPYKWVIYILFLVGIGALKKSIKSYIVKIRKS